MEELIKELKAQNKLLARIIASNERSEFIPSDEERRLAKINDATQKIILWCYE